MSIRAYKVIKIDHEESESFNLSHNFDLVTRLGSFVENLNTDCAGLSTIYKDDVEFEIENTRAKIQEKWSGHESAKEWEEALEVLENILSDMGEGDYVEYYCY